MRSILLLLFLMLGCNAPVVVFPSNDPVSLYMEAVPVLVNSQGRPICAGFFSQNKLVTAAHCVDSLKIVALMPETREPITFQLEEINELADVAILAAEGDYSPPRQLPMSSQDPDAGELLVGVGHPMGLPYAYCELRFVSRRERTITLLPEIWLQFTGVADRGYSGGPVVNRYGHVVGLMSFGAGESVVGVAPWSEIQDAIDSD